MFTFHPIGPLHPDYVKGRGPFTQMQLTRIFAGETEVVAQFFGAMAKLNAECFAYAYQKVNKLVEDLEKAQRIEEAKEE